MIKNFMMYSINLHYLELVLVVWGNKLAKKNS